MTPSLRITELFYSIQGESNTSGYPTVFVRLTGCPLRCQFCDTAYAFQGGNLISIDRILEQISAYKTSHVCVTGGEPLAQPNCIPLLQRLCDANYIVSIETSGALDISQIDPRVLIVMDLKTPGSGEVSKNLWTNIPLLKAQDQIKFVICDHDDYLWACDMIKQYQLTEKAHVIFSTSWEQLNPTDLANWILADHLPVRFQLQLHKILWADAKGH
ncbi:MAG: 7-carboxy-7-deazaguanine synthase QueE [Legionellaceae bacterium]|nr:7-carboxy-7-deazaguanine synthase QueE [Legionellaceae bacterium]MBP9775921.1 7-carboxy-7-deazaguanine synthase QueE [Legionellaceae bacterium]